MKLHPFILLLSALPLSPLHAENLYKPGNWASLASDRKAEKAGDSITVIVATNQQASNSVRKGSRKRSAVDGRISAGNRFDNSASLGFGGSYDGEGTNARTDKVVAQLSAVVDSVEGNGDLHISGEQHLNINGELTRIRISGRVRSDDISADNTVLSSRLADAVIDYNGHGFASRSAKPGVVTKIFNWLGIL